MHDEKPLIVREHLAAHLLGVSISAMRRWRREGRGPAFLRLERCIGYRMVDLEAYIRDSRVETLPPSPEESHAE